MSKVEELLKKRLRPKNFVILTFDQFMVMHQAMMRHPEQYECSETEMRHAKDLCSIGYLTSGLSKIKFALTAKGINHMAKEGKKDYGKGDTVGEVLPQAEVGEHEQRSKPH